MWDTISQHLESITGISLQSPETRSIGGGCINQGYQLVFQNTQNCYFVKLNRSTQIQMFQAEAAGLEAIAATETILVPRPLCWGTTGNHAYLVLNWLDLGGNHWQGWQKMGRQLARLHHLSQSDRGFGWTQQNTIGSTVQTNDWCTDWPTFWRDRRIVYQLQLGRRNGGHFPRGDDLLAAIPDLLLDHAPKPALVHGDLWSGNAAITQTGEPVIFDPAPYYGDREVDLAMTELFGAFPTAFYQGYEQEWPLPTGHQQRKELYNLYHLLNHFNLFGGSYESSANRTIARLLA